MVEFSNPENRALYKQACRWLVITIAFWLLFCASATPGQAGGTIPLTPAETQWLTNHPDIRIAPTADYQPVECLDTNNQYSGITAEYFQLIQQRLGCRFTVVRPTQAQWLELDPIKRGADVITASADTPQRDAYWIYTKVFLELPTYVITRDEASDGLTLNRLAGQRVAVVQGWAAEEYLRSHYPDLIIQPVPDAEAGLRKVSFGLADAFVSELPVATVWMEREGISNLKISAEAGYTYKLAISIRKDWPELCSILDKALATITPDERQQIIERWLKLKTPEERRAEEIRRKLLWTAGGLLALLVGALAWNRLLAWRIHVATSELRLSEEKFSKSFHNSPLPKAITSMEDGRMLDVNDAFLSMHGFAQSSDVIGRTSLELGLWDNPDERREFIERLRVEKRILNSKLKFRRVNSDVGIGLYSFELITIAGKTCSLVLINDITEQERTAAALVASEEKFSKAFRSSPLAIAVTNFADGTFLDVNDAFLKMNGYSSRDQVIGRTSIELEMWENPEDRPGFATRLREEKRILNLKRNFRRADGSIGTGLFSIETIELWGQLCGLLMINDITDHERVEAALRENELRLRLMADLIAGYSYSYLVGTDRTTKLEWLSQAGEKVFGYTEAELKSSVRFREQVRKEDLPILQSAIDSVLAGIPEVTEFRFRTKSGQFRWLQCFNRPEWSDQEKRVVRILGAGQDVTERRTSEQALRDSLENTPNVCVQWLDEHGQIIYWNHASRTTYGWNASEAVRKNIGELIHNPEQRKAFDQMLQTVKTTGKAAGPREIGFLRQDGQVGICLSTLFTIMSPAGEKIYARMDVDLTELKCAEADRTQLLGELHVAEDTERRRIARELHDSTAQQLAVLKMNLTLLRKRSPELGESLQESLALTDQAIQDIRNFTWMLHPPLLEELGLTQALTDYAAGFGRRSGIQTAVETVNFSGRLPATSELALFRVAQESLTNILRHSQSKTALVRLDRDDEEVRLEIQDTGCGMPDNVKAGVGMAGMRERLRLVGGSLNIESDNEGTTVLATIPLHSHGHDTEFLFRVRTQGSA